MHVCKESHPDPWEIVVLWPLRVLTAAVLVGFVCERYVSDRIYRVCVVYNKHSHTTHICQHKKKDYGQTIAHCVPFSCVRMRLDVCLVLYAARAVET